MDFVVIYPNYPKILMINSSTKIWMRRFFFIIILLRLIVSTKIWIRKFFFYNNIFKIDRIDSKIMNFVITC